MCIRDRLVPMPSCRNTVVLLGVVMLHRWLKVEEAREICTVILEPTATELALSVKLEARGMVLQVWVPLTVRGLMELDWELVYWAEKENCLVPSLLWLTRVEPLAST